MVTLPKHKQTKGFKKYTMVWVEFALLLAVIFIGSRLKGMSLGILGGLGLAILAFCLRVQPTKPPFDVLLVIIAVVTAVGTVEAAGGLQYLIRLAEALLRKHPQQITFLGPFVTYFIVLLAGTNHIVYSLLPIIAAVSRGVGIRPERPLSVAVIAALHGFLASPISAATALIVGLLSPHGIELLTVLTILIPATLGGVLVATLVASKLGKELHQDPEYLRRLAAAPKEAQPQATSTANPKVSRTAKLSVSCFILGGVLIVLLGAFKTLRPSWESNGVLVWMNMPTVITLIMLSISALIILLGGLLPSAIVQGKAFIAGIQALISILGIAWLSDTFIQANQAHLVALIQEKITAPWQFSIILFIMSAIIVSPSATIRAIIPLGIILGIPPLILLASLPAVNGVFFLPSFPTILAAVNLDSTGTTRIGKLLLNHSFMLPGLVAMITAVAIAFSLIILC